VTGSGGPIAAGTTITPLFSFSGLYASQPVVRVGNGGAVTITFQPVPEAAWVCLMCGVAAATVCWGRRRRQRPVVGWLGRSVVEDRFLTT